MDLTSFRVQRCLTGKQEEVVGLTVRLFPHIFSFQGIKDPFPFPEASHSAVGGLVLRRSIGGEFGRDVGETVNGCLSVG